MNQLPTLKTPQVSTHPLRKRLASLFHQHRLLAELRNVAWSLRYPRTIPRAILWFVNSLNPRDIKVQTCCADFWVSTGDPSIGREIYLNRSFEEDLIERTISLLRTVNRQRQNRLGTFVDVGANIGPIAIAMLKKRAFDSAIAIEPDPANYRLLQKNIQLNYLSERVVSYKYACSDKMGRLPFEQSISNFGDHRIRNDGSQDLAGAFNEESRKVIFVDSKPIDELLFDCVPPIGCVWIDVQGHEGYVLKGGPRVFGAKPPTVIEFWPYGIIRSGMTKEQFFKVVRLYFGTYYDLQEETPKRRDLRTLENAWEDMMGPGIYANYLFVE